jgi:hypothetical protein
MWIGGMPAGVCGKDSYGERPECPIFRDAYTGEMRRTDGKYNGYVPGLACPAHGGPSLKDVSHKGDPCIYCGKHHDDVKPGACPGIRKDGE